MRNSLLIILLAISVFACVEADKIPETKPSRFCSNELDLLSSFDTLKTIDYSIWDLSNNWYAILDSSYERDICCEYLHFNTYFQTDSNETIKLSMNSYYDCENCPTYLITRNVCVILLNSAGKVLFEGHSADFDSVSDLVFTYYLNVGISPYYPETYNKVELIVLRDSDVSKNNFRVFYNNIIDGYLKFAKHYSIDKYGKKLCELNKAELIKLAKSLPFNLVLEKLYTIPIDDKHLEAIEKF